jgi:hypothetical protein
MVTTSVRAANFLGVFAPAPPAPGGAVARLPFADTFESGSLAAWNIVGGTVGVTTLEAFGGVRSAFTEVLAGNQSDNYLEFHFGDHQGVSGTPTGTNEIWLKFAHKWASNYVDTSVPNQKLLLLNSHNPATNRRRYQLTFNWSEGSSAYFFEFFRWNEDGSFGGNVQAVQLVTGFPRVKGRWEEFVFRIKMNAVGLSDGHLQVWTKAQGDTSYVERVNRTNCNYRESTAFTPNRLIGLSNFDTLTTRDGRRYWDSIQLQQEPISVAPDPPVGDNDGLVVSDFASFDPDAASRISLDINNTIPTATSTGASVTFLTKAWWNGSSVGVARIVPPTIGDGYSGFSSINLWKNGQKVIRQVNIRQECLASDLFCADSTQMPKWLILVCPRALDLDATVDRPMMYLNHMNTAEGTPAEFQIANTLVLCPAQGTVRLYSLINNVPGPLHSQQDGSTISGNASMRQPFYVRATAGVDGAGNPIIAASEYLSVEMRVNLMSTGDEPNGFIGWRVTRRNGNVFERGCAFTYWPNPPGGVNVDTNYVGWIDVMGGGYFNNPNDGNPNRYIEIGRRLTLDFNLSPTLGRAWIGAPTGFVTG